MFELSAVRIHITGVVQGVGFRPFVHNLAAELGLAGWVLNSSSGVEIEAVGPAAALEGFAERLVPEAPPLARIDRFEVTAITAAEVHDLQPGVFVIRHSEGRPGEFLPISPDVAICPDCLRELFDPGDRRHRYPFINCTNCGPRFTIIRDIPYDRPLTTMAPFRMCPNCQAEYDDPTDRRFHAQPNACPLCGPRVWLHVPGSADGGASQDPILGARDLLRNGAVLAVKGLGGFHLACDATDDGAVALLRERKGRVDKPFALMSFDLPAVERYCQVGEEERALVSARERPIVLLGQHPDIPISPLVAPGQVHLGVMLPYTPLHYLLLEPDPGFPIALVMTSGNYSEEPIATGNDEALDRLAPLADAFLLNDREIHARCDDSVTRVFRGAELPVRRSRGYAPYPVHLPFAVGPVLAVGAELKNTFCLTRERYAFVSQHIGDMENYETLRFFQQMVEQLARTFRVRPQTVACDLHPAYLTTRYARELAAGEALPGTHRSPGDETGASRARPMEFVSVQHHHAHIAACMAENGLDGARPVIGVALDGTGYGSDGAIWGGEFLVADYGVFRRAAHLKYVPLPGGDAAIRRPYRIALAYLWAAGLPWEEDLPPVAAAPPDERTILLQQLERGLNTVPTSSCGRLFDAVAALAGVRQRINYEAQAAMELEGRIGLEDTLQQGEAEPYRFSIGAPAAPAEADGTAALSIDPAPVIEAVAADVWAGVSAGLVAARFHAGLARMIVDVCTRLRAEAGLEEVALSGGVFQNATLLGQVLRLLEESGFVVYTHHLVPPNDGGISLGQAVVAGVRIGRED
jgi:hydrogenase maturation protein HypF